MSSLQLVKKLRKLSSVQSILWHGVRLRRGRGGGPLPNTLDPDKDFYMDDDFENEPVADLDEDPNAKHKPKKLTPWEEREQQKELLKKQIQKKKEIKGYSHKEPSLLTWAARAQMKHLHSIDPEQWDLDTLARSFPVSKFAIKEILRSRLIPYDRQHIIKHDRTVHKNWMKLKEQAQAYIEGKPMDPEFGQVLEDEHRRSCLINAAGIPNFPIPQEQNIVQTMTDIAEEARPVVKREFSTILDKCKSNQDNLNIANEDTVYIGFNNQEMQALLESIAKLNSEESDDDHIEENEQQLRLPGDKNMSDYHSDVSTAETSPWSRHSKHDNYRRNVKYSEMNQFEEGLPDLRQSKWKDHRDTRHGYNSDESAEETYSRPRSSKYNKNRRNLKYDEMNQEFGQSEEDMHDFRQNKWKDNRQRDHRQRDHKPRFDNRRDIAGEEREQNWSKKQWNNNYDYGNTKDHFRSEYVDDSYRVKSDKRNIRSHREHQGQKFAKIRSPAKHDQSFNRYRDRYDDQHFRDDFRGSFQDRRPNRITGSLDDIYLLNRPTDGYRSNKKWSKGSKGGDRDDEY